MPSASPPIDRPSPQLAAPGWPMGLRRAFLATRPAFFVASILPVLVGTAWAATAYDRFDPLLFALALAATALAHAATNVYNDIGDDLIGADAGNDERLYPYTGGSRFIQTGLMSRAQMSRLAIGLAALALLLGAMLTLLRGPGVVLLGAAGLALGLLYSLPRVQLSARGVGELAVAIGLGVLPVLGAVWLQAGAIDVGAMLVCVPVSAWVAAIIVINEVPDIESDRRAGKRTLVVRWGVGGARWIYGCLTGIALLAAVLAVARHALPMWYLLAAAALAAAGTKAMLGMRRGPDERARLRRSIELTLTVHGVGCAALIIATLTAAPVMQRLLAG
jgi:1,4-dihydroxy-2-naphthoate octaprenyltransferase